MSLAVGLDVYEGMSLSDLELDHLIQYHVDLNELIHTLGPLAQCLAPAQERNSRHPKGFRREVPMRVHCTTPVLRTQCAPLL